MAKKKSLSDRLTELKMKGRLKGGRKKLTSEKAREILSDGTAHGRKLTKNQKGFFGWVAGGRKK